MGAFVNPTVGVLDTVAPHGDAVADAAFLAFEDAVGQPLMVDSPSM